MKKNNKGFTLGELLAVVALIGILVAISVVIFSGRIAEAKENVCKNNRDSMKHGTVVVSMTERTNWLAEYGNGGVNSPSSEKIINFLLDEGYIDDFNCPAGGIIYAAKTESDRVIFKCTYHDDSIEPGEENFYNQAAKDLAEAVNKYITNEYKKYPDNDGIVRGFMETEASEKFVISGTTKDLLTDSVIDYIAKQMVIIEKISEEDVEKFRKSLISFRDEEVYLVPYVGKSVKEGNAVITYYTSKDDYNNRFKVSDGQKHGVVSLLCFEGKWYISTSIHFYSKVFTPNALMPKFTFTENIQKTLDELEKDHLIIAI